MSGLLSLTTFAPIIGVAVILAARAFSGASEKTDTLAKWIALATTLVTFGLSIVLTLQFDPKNPGFQFVEDFAWFAGLHYRMGVDGISVLFVLLTAFLMPICIIASWKSVEKRVVEYMIAFLVLETLMIGVFCALDMVLFYLFFEAGLIPMFLIIGIWGGKRRVYAAYKFFLYTLLGSVLMLAAILAMYGITGTTDIARPDALQVPPWLQTWLWLAFFASFAVKMPMWPVHTWLPDAHVEAPTAGSVILAAHPAEDGRLRLHALQPADVS
jgi:NADH-quinone oxidoreductase subunit M